MCGTVSADKNEILFKEFNINYNNEPNIFKRGTLLLRKSIKNENLKKTFIVDVHDDMLKNSYWKDNYDILSSKSTNIHEGPITHIINEQIGNKKYNLKKLEESQ